MKINELSKVSFKGFRGIKLFGVGSRLNFILMRDFFSTKLINIFRLIFRLIFLNMLGLLQKKENIFSK